MTTRRPGFTAAAALSQTSIGVNNPGAHRYWRLLATSTQVGGTGGNDNFAVAEVAMRAFLNGSDVAGGKTYASSSDTGAANDADKAFDDLVGTYLDTTDATNAWVSVDFGVGNDSEVHEIAFTNVPTATRKAPAELYVEYSDDNVIWDLAWRIIPDPWTDTQETRVFSAPYGEAQFATTDFANMSANLPCVGAWGTILRNHGYTGPALRVEDNGNPGTFVDINFGPDGFIREPRPYGADTRVVTLYDQFGTTDLFAGLVDNIQIREDDGTFGTWLLDFNAQGELTSTNLTNGTQAWEVSEAVWGCGFKRVGDTAVRLIWGIPALSNFMKMGLWQEQRDLHWRINSSNPADWLGTDWITDANVVQGGIERAIGDMSDGSPAQAWYKGVNGGTRSHTSPVTYDAAQPLNMGGGILSDFDGYISELAIFDPTVPLSDGDKDLLDAALAEADFFVTGQEIQVQEQRSHIVMGGPPANAVAAKIQREYAVLGGPPANAVAASKANEFVILGIAADQITTRAQRLHVIIVP